MQVPLYLQQLYLFIQQGGLLLWSIVALSCFMWLLILERYDYLWRIYPKRRQQLQQQWLARSEHHSWYAHRIRMGLISQAHNELNRFLCVLSSLPQMLLLLGLLGTVHGMISVFDVLSQTSQIHLRGIASGISLALLTTLAGLLTALPGLYFATRLCKRVELEQQRLADLLTFA